MLLIAKCLQLVCIENHQGHGKIGIVDYLADLVDHAYVFDASLTEGWHLEFRSAKYVAITPTIDLIVEQFRVLSLVALLVTCLICLKVHFEIKISNEVIEVSLKLIQSVKFLLQFHLFIF